MIQEFYRDMGWKQPSELKNPGTPDPLHLFSSLANSLGMEKTKLEPDYMYFAVPHPAVVVGTFVNGKPTYNTLSDFGITCGYRYKKVGHT